MQETKNSIQESPRLTALKTAIQTERRSLELDSLASSPHAQALVADRLSEASSDDSTVTVCSMKPGLTRVSTDF